LTPQKEWRTQSLQTSKNLENRRMDNRPQPRQRISSPAAKALVDLGAHMAAVAGKKTTK